MNRYLSSLMRSPLFESMNQTQVEKVLAASNIVKFGRGETVMKEDEPGDSLFIMLEGAVEISKNLVKIGLEPDEKSKTFARLDSQDHAVFGEIGLLGESKRTATVRALTDCSLCEIKKDDFFRLADADYGIGYRILANLGRLLSLRLRKADEELVKLTTVLTIVLKK